MNKKSSLYIAIKARNFAKYKLEKEKTNLRKANIVLGKAFRIERKLAGYSLRSMAKKLEISPAYLSGIELGRKNLPEFWNIKVKF